jgi:glutamate-1-semialdehyde 2,1-aminomutase
MIDAVGHYEGSETLHAEAAELLPGGVSSNFRLGGPSVPLFFERAEGSCLYDVDGNRYIDYVLGMGPAVLGHAPAEATAAVEASLAQGQLFAGQHRGEIDLARLVVELVPSAELVRFGLAGSEMVQLALRLARAATGRTKIVKFEGHYHGWYDTALVSTAPTLEGDEMRDVGEPSAQHLPSLGQSTAALADVDVLPWNDLAEVEAYLERNGATTAALIMEPILCNTCVISPRPGYLEGVRQLCDRYGVLLVFDEVICGFRVAAGGAQELLGVLPDMTVLAKAMGGGFPVAALAGRRDVMTLAGDGRVLHGGTYNTNVVSTAAALAVLGKLRSDGATIYADLDRRGTELMSGLRELAAERDVPLHVQGLGAVFNTCFIEGGLEIHSYRDYRHADAEKQRAFLRALLHRGVRITSRGTWFLSAAHTDADIERTLEAAGDALDAL